MRMMFAKLPLLVAILGVPVHGQRLDCYECAYGQVDEAYAYGYHGCEHPSPCQAPVIRVEPYEWYPLACRTPCASASASGPLIYDCQSGLYGMDVRVSGRGYTFLVNTFNETNIAAVQPVFHNRCPEKALPTTAYTNSSTPGNALTLSECLITGLQGQLQKVSIPGSLLGNVDALCAYSIGACCNGSCCQSGQMGFDCPKGCNVTNGTSPLSFVQKVLQTNCPTERIYSMSFNGEGCSYYSICGLLPGALATPPTIVRVANETLPWNINILAFFPFFPRDRQEMGADGTLPNSLHFIGKTAIAKSGGSLNSDPRANSTGLFEPKLTFINTGIRASIVPLYVTIAMAIIYYVVIILQYLPSALAILLNSALGITEDEEAREASFTECR